MSDVPETETPKTVIQLDEIQRLTLEPEAHGFVRLGVESAHEDSDGNLDWENPDGSWTMLTPAVAQRLCAALAAHDTPPPAAQPCTCPRFRDTGGLRIADLGCPIHGVDGSDPGDGPRDDDERPTPTEAPSSSLGDVSDSEPTSPEDLRCPTCDGFIARKARLVAEGGQPDADDELLVSANHAEEVLRDTGYMDLADDVRRLGSALRRRNFELDGAHLWHAIAKGWGPASTIPVKVVDRATDRVMELLSDPTEPEETGGD